MEHFLQNLTQQIRLADLLDIAVVSLVLYIALSWFRQRASRAIGISLLGFLLLYVVASYLGMYLTTRVFQVGFLGAALAFIVVFQQDIRQGVERLASYRWRRRKRQLTTADTNVTSLCDSIEKLAEDRIGALLVFPARQPLDRHLRGGIPVNGEISVPLLLSIFHPKSPGHDGAVLIQDGRVAQLGAHLPLSIDVAKVHGGGTRHTAALGLAERCDALVVVVSEERGTVSLAEKGSIQVIDSADLPARLKTHLDAHGENGDSGRTGWQDLPTKALALFLASVCWFLFAYQTTTVQRTLVVPIEYRNLPERWVVNDPKESSAEVTLSGSEQGFELLDVSKIAVSLEIKNPREGVPIRLQTEDSLKGIPVELNVTRINPREVFVILSDGKKP
ncbi:hypothetical protein FYK55_18580 [Roseiconus nitratireducens]|uniref:DAC domain-containing protein n=1 Tax=Roseiconus nitratireducens TaxID=2605748 RepID=A0A5M6D3Q8_9BACT|nr:diadenylate cyclase [Roseiconus nitratireducens]KAA5540922.1 hypothetical protein FYK55_18580 [Roseiconus nitratireducens]